MTKSNNILLLVTGLLFITLITVLAYYIKPVPEDYVVIAIGKGQLFAYPKILYLTYCGRFLGMVMQDAVIRAVLHGMSPVFYYLPCLIFLLLSLFFILNKLVAKYQLQLSLFTKWNIVLLFSATLFYLTIGEQESWFWLLTSQYYGIICLAFTAAGIALWMADKSSLFVYVALFFCFFYVGSATEPFALMLILFFVLRLSNAFRANGKRPRTKFFIAFAGCLIGFLSVYIAPGTHSRWQLMPHVTPLLAVRRDIGAVVKFYLYYFPAKIPLMILFGLPCFFIGAYLKKTSTIKLPAIPIFKLILGMAILFTTILSLAFLPCSFVMGEAGPLRSWFHISIYMTLTTWVFFLYLGYTAKRESAYSSILFNVVLIVAIGFSLYTIVDQYLTVSLYSARMDDRISQLKDLKKKHTKGVIYLDKLPPSGMLYSGEISKDTANLTNTYLKQGLGLGFSVSLNEDEELCIE
jgi:hypothetical protein